MWMFNNNMTIHLIGHPSTPSLINVSMTNAYTDCLPISKINTNINIKFQLNISNQVQIDLPQKFFLYQYILLSFSKLL